MSIIDDLNYESDLRERDRERFAFLPGCACGTCIAARVRREPPPVTATEQEEDGRLRMTAEVYGYKYVIEGHDEMTLDELFGRVIIPLVSSMGYGDEGIAKLFVDGDPRHWDSAYGMGCDC